MTEDGFKKNPGIVAAPTDKKGRLPSVFDVADLFFPVESTQQDWETEQEAGVEDELHEDKRQETFELLLEALGVEGLCMFISSGTLLEALQTALHAGRITREQYETLTKEEPEPEIEPEPESEPIAPFPRVPEHEDDMPF